MKDLLIIGTLPETAGIGGVAVHVQRLLAFLDKEQISYKFADYKISSIWSVILMILKAKVVHLHLSNPYARLLFIVVARLSRAKVIVTFHGNYSRIQNRWVKYSFKWATVPVVINGDSYATASLLNSRTKLLPAFILPQSSTPLDEKTLAVLDKVKQTHTRLFATNAYRYAIDADGNEIYGIDFLCDYFEKTDIGCLVVSDPSGENKQRQGGTLKNTVFIDYPHNFYEVLKRSDVFVRNTSTDGDSLSVREALHLKVPTLCSDCVKRPSGVILFKYNDAHSLSDAYDKVRNNNENVVIEEDATGPLRELYSLLLASK